MATKGKIEFDKLLTNSMRNLWCTCHRRFYYRNVEGLEPIVQAPALALGSMWHEGLRAYYAGKCKPEIAGLHPFTNWEEAIDHYFDTYVETLAQLPNPDMAQLAHDKAQERLHTAMGMLRSYVDFWRGFDAWEILAIEQRVEMRLRTPKGNPSHWRYAGKLDLVVRDRHTARVLVVDHKSTSKDNREGFASELSLDPQSRGYLMLVNAVRDGELDGIPAGMQEALAGGPPVVDFVWDVQRSKLPADPKTLVCAGKCHNAVKKGGTANPTCPKCHGTDVTGISVAQGVDTTVELLDAALERYPHLDPNEYEELRTRLRNRSDSWCYQLEQNYTLGELADFHQESYEVTREISEAGYWTRNFGACFAPGRVCPYRNLCLTEGNASLASEARNAFRLRELNPTAELDDKDAGSELPF